MSNHPDAKKPTAKKHISVIYFHGMGSQRRYEETSRLIDAVDTYLRNAWRNRREALGILRKIDPVGEVSRVDPDRTVTYIGTTYIPPHLLDGSPQAQGIAREDGTGEKVEVRFYEAYWAPIMAGASSPFRVVQWLLSQVGRPWQTIRTVWRERQRLRRSALARLRGEPTKWPPGTDDGDGKRDGDFEHLLAAYAEFDNNAHIDDYPEGTFEQFLTFIRRHNAHDEPTRERLCALANRWRTYYRNTELKTLFYVVTIFVGLVAMTAWLMISTYEATLFFIETKVNGSFVEQVMAYLRLLLDRDHNPMAVLGPIIALFLIFKSNRFLVDYLGDVEAWATYEETNGKHARRREVIDLGTDLITHVLKDENCERAMIVSHSLGTSIAHDTLLSLARRTKVDARTAALGRGDTSGGNPMAYPVPLERLRHFVTIASPIDKINYFFESYRSIYRRYVRVVESLRGDISDIPFSRSRMKPHIHWVNYWDEADWISGALHSPTGREAAQNSVDNVHINNLAFPLPGKAHSAYFGNRRLIGDIFDMAYLGDHSFEHTSLKGDGGRRKYSQVVVAKGDPLSARHWHLKAMLALPWVGCLYVIAYTWGADALAGCSLIIFATLFGALYISARMLGTKENKLPL